MTSSQWRIMSRESAGCHTTSYDSCRWYVSHYRRNHVKLSSTRLCQADSTTLTVCFTVSTNFNSTCCSLSFVPLLAWFSVSGNLIFLKIRDKLHWLPVRKRIEFKICTTVYKCLHGGAPPYLVEMMLPVTDTPALRCLRSATRGDLIIPSTETVRFGPRSFNVSGPTLWNSLPVNIRQCKSFESFKKQLKTLLYLRADSS